jgi:HD superfamily phosphohydrolase YqeK
VTKFYVEVRQENGEKYKKCRLIALRHDGLNRFLQSNSSFDIVNGQEFKESKHFPDELLHKILSPEISK